MKTIIIKTQKEWNDLPKEFSELTKIEIKTDGSFWLEIKTTPKNGTVYAYDSSTVTASDSSTVTACGSSKVYAYDSSKVSACDSSKVSAYGSSTVTASDSSKVSAYDSSKVSAYDSSTVTASDSSTVTASDSSTVTACDSSKVSAYGSSTVTASDSSTVTAYDSSKVYASDSSKVSAYDSSKVTAYFICVVFVYSSLVKIKHLADQTTAKFLNGSDHKKVIIKKDRTAQIIAKVKEPSFETWIERGIVKADGLTQRLVSKKKLGTIESYEVENHLCEKSFVVKKGEIFAHGKTIKEAKDSLKYKISSRDTSEFKKWKLDTIVTQEKMIQAYRAITGACEFGVKSFCEGKKIPSKIKVKDAIKLTAGNYGSDQFASFFK